MSHTKGPWEIHYEYDITGYPCFYIHGFAGEQKRDEDTLCANARLIAAAPQLVSALREIYDWAANREDITWNDQPNDAMEVKGMISIHLGDLVESLLKDGAA